MKRLMDFEDTRKYLKTSKSTLYRLVQGGKIPAAKIGNQWRFNREHLDKWFETRENTKKKK